MSYITVQTKKTYDFYLGIVDYLMHYIKVKKQEDDNNAVSDAAPVIARYDLQNENVQVKMEYFIYINQYGVPSDGIFIEEYLDRIRKGLSL
jgi:hypothetical protein